MTPASEAADRSLLANCTHVASDQRSGYVAFTHRSVTSRSSFGSRMAAALDEERPGERAVHRVGELEVPVAERPVASLHPSDRQRRRTASASGNASYLGEERGEEIADTLEALGPEPPLFERDHRPRRRGHGRVDMLPVRPGLLDTESKPEQARVHLGRLRWTRRSWNLARHRSGRGLHPLILQSCRRGEDTARRAAQALPRGGGRASRERPVAAR